VIQIRPLETTAIAAVIHAEVPSVWVPLLSTENGVSYANHTSTAWVQSVYCWNEPQAQQQHPMMPRNDGCKYSSESRSNRGFCNGHGHCHERNCSVASATTAVLAATVAAATAEFVLLVLGGSSCLFQNPASCPLTTLELARWTFVAEVTPRAVATTFGRVEMCAWVTSSHSVVMESHCLSI